MPPLVVTAALIEHDGNVLLARRPSGVPYAGYWEFPGGKLEEGEDPADCVVREVREELGIGISVEGVYDVVFHRYPERTVLLIVYRCRWTGGDIQDLGVSEHRWVEPGSVTSYQLLPADVPLAARLCREMDHAHPPRL